MDIQFDATAAVQLLDVYPKRVQTATVRALNKALVTGRATVARLVAADMGIAVGVAKDKIRVDKATPSNLSIRLRASLRRLPLKDFKGQGVRGRNKVPGAFVARMPHQNPLLEGHLGVYKRRGISRLPIVELYGASIGRVFIKHEAAGIAAMREAFDKNLAHELEFASKEGL